MLVKLRQFSKSESCFFNINKKESILDLKGQSKMKCLLLIILILILSGCATAKLPNAERYPRATYETKQQLFQDLDSGKLTGATLDYVRSTYGNPESMTYHGAETLIIYRRPRYTDSAYLWFDSEKQLESWSH